MAALDPDDLLAQARFLLIPRQPGPPLQVDVRRAISAAYYALFHHVVAAAADYLIGKTKHRDPRYSIAYRSVDHATLRSACINARTAKTALTEELKEFADSFVVLQAQRHSADYDPATLMRTSEAKLAIAEAAKAIQLFDNVPQEERLLFLTQLAFRRRH
jgi:uncharacterized protein (UPF0332 family)